MLSGIFAKEKKALILYAQAVVKLWKKRWFLRRDTESERPQVNISAAKNRLLVMPNTSNIVYI